MKIIMLTVTILILLCLVQIVFGQKRISKNKNNSRLILSCGVCSQKAIYLPKPEYPKAAKAVNASGLVQVQIVINENGNVIEAKPISGHPLLWTKSVKAALKAKFEPFRLSGKAVKVRDIIVYNFVLN